MQDTTGEFEVPRDVEEAYTLPPRRSDPSVPLPSRKSLTPAGVPRRVVSPGGRGSERRRFAEAAVAALLLAMVVVFLTWCGLTAYRIHSTSELTRVADRAWADRALDGADAILLLRPLGAAEPAELEDWIHELTDGEPAAVRQAATDVRAALEAAVGDIEAVPLSEMERMARAQGQLEELQRIESYARGLHEELYAYRATLPGRTVRLLQIVD